MSLPVQKSKSIVLSGRGWDISPAHDKPAPAPNMPALDKADHDDTARWPIWKAGLLVISLCGVFWVCVGAILLSVLG